MRILRGLIACVLGLGLGACGTGAAARSHTAPPASAVPTRALPPGPGVSLVAAGDIACPPASRTPPDRSACAQADTAALVRSLRPDAVALLGDDQYGTGALRDFRRSFAPTWGRFRPRTHPAPGNHEYGTPGAAGYIAYFGSAAGPRGRGYYSYALGSWHVVVLDSNLDCSAISCARGSAQERWLRADLAAYRARCTLAYWHHPRFSSGPHGDDAHLAPFWDDLYAARADVVLNGHDHDYERFRPQDPAGRPDPRRGIAEWVVGTGGRSHYRFVGTPRATSAVRDATSFGVLRLDLRRTGYAWTFLPAAGGRFTDSGTGRCH